MPRKLEKRERDPEPLVQPMLKTVEQMSRISGIGENRLRELMDNGELEYVPNGNRRLIADAAIWAWYERSKVMETRRERVREDFTAMTDTSRDGQAINGRHTTSLRARMQHGQVLASQHNSSI